MSKIQIGNLPKIIQKSPLFNDIKIYEDDTFFIQENILILINKYQNLEHEIKTIEEYIYFLLISSFFMLDSIYINKKLENFEKDPNNEIDILRYLFCNYDNSFIKERLEKVRMYAEKNILKKNKNFYSLFIDINLEDENIVKKIFNCEIFSTKLSMYKNNNYKIVKLFTSISLEYTKIKDIIYNLTDSYEYTSNDLGNDICTNIEDKNLLIYYSGKKIKFKYNSNSFEMMENLFEKMNHIFYLIKQYIKLNTIFFISKKNPLNWDNKIYLFLPFEYSIYDIENINNNKKSNKNNIKSNTSEAKY